jgi:hypothetical protein
MRRRSSALQILRKDGWMEQGIGVATKIEVAVREPATIHTVTLAQIERWLNGATISPNERLKRERLRGCCATSTVPPTSFADPL